MIIFSNWNWLHVLLLSKQFKGIIDMSVKQVPQVFFVFLAYYLSLNSLQPACNNRSPAQTLLGGKYHSASRNSGGRSLRKIVNFKEDPHFSFEFDSFSIREAQSHIVIKHGIHIFYPYCIDWSIKYNPLHTN